MYDKIPCYLPQILSIASVLVIQAMLIYGAIWDYRERIIPNKVPVAIFICGLFSQLGWGYQLVSLAIIIVSLLAATAITKKKSGGGDIKTYCALAFSCGIFTFLLILIVSMLLLPILKKRLGRDEHGDPRCCYLCISYAIVYALIIGINVFANLSA